MIKLFSCVGIGAATVLCVNVAGAQTFPAHGNFAIGVERVFGIDYSKTTEKAPDTNLEVESSITSVSFLGSMPTTVGAIPRFNFDVFLGPGISVGGGLMYQHRGADNKAAGATTTTSTESSGSYFLFAPRVGFGIPINDTLAIWPRLGLSYLYSTGENETVNSATGVRNTTDATTGTWYTTVDALLLISPVKHVAFSVGPALDVLIGGPTRTQNGRGVATGDTSAYSIGLHAGMTAWF